MGMYAEATVTVQYTQQMRHDLKVFLDLEVEMSDCFAILNKEKCDKIVKAAQAGDITWGLTYLAVVIAADQHTYWLKFCVDSEKLSYELPRDVYKALEDKHMAEYQLIFC